MTDNSTIARPYAKAAFSYAKEKNATGSWRSFLHLLAAIVSDEKVQVFLHDPNRSKEEHLSFLESVLTENASREQMNFCHLLVDNKRLAVMPGIVELFEQMLAELEKTQEVVVRSFSELSEQQQQKLNERLAKKFNREVSLTVEIDKSIGGGIFVEAGDVVVDLSIRGQLDKLTRQLA